MTQISLLCLHKAIVIIMWCNVRRNSNWDIFLSFRQDLYGLHAEVKYISPNLNCKSFNKLHIRIFTNNLNLLRCILHSLFRIDKSVLRAMCANYILSYLFLKLKIFIYTNLTIIIFETIILFERLNSQIIF